MPERRKYFRIDESLKLSYESKGMDNILSQCNIKNISQGGVCFPTMYNLLTGDVLDLEIKLPEFLESVKAEGKIVWKKEEYFANFRYLLGIEFNALAPAQEEKLASHIKRGIEQKDSPSLAWLG